jgi:hypothetical protein
VSNLVEIEEDEMDGACSMHDRVDESIHGFGRKTSRKE